MSVHLLHDADVTVDDLNRLARSLEPYGAAVIPLVVDPRRLEPLPSQVAAHGGAISCARFLLPELLPDLDRVLYLDADTLTVASVEALWSTSLGEAAIAGVPNVVDSAVTGRLRRLGFPEGATYFNSGVLLMDLAALRQRDALRQVLDVLRAKGDDLHWVDQDAMNLALGDAIMAVHPRWNAQNAFWLWREQADACLDPTAVRDAVANPAIVHFEGHWLAKPWHYMCRHPYAAAWRSALSRTPWSGHPLMDRTVATRTIRRLPEPWRTQAYERLLGWRRRHRGSAALTSRR